MTGKVPDQDEFASHVIADVNSVALMLQAATIRAQINSEQTKLESTRIQGKVSRSARRRRKKKRRQQLKVPQGTGGESEKNNAHCGQNKYNRPITGSSGARRNPYRRYPREYEHASVSRRPHMSEKTRNQKNF